MFFKKGFFTLKNIPLSLTGLYNPFFFKNSKCEIADFDLNFPLNQSVYYGKIGSNDFFDRINYFFSSKQSKDFDFAVCENPIGSF